MFTTAPARAAGSGARRSCPGRTASGGGSTPPGTCSPSRARSAASSRPRSRKSGAARSRRLARLLQEAHRRIDDEQPPVPVPPEELVRGRARCPASLAARAPALLERFRRYLREHRQPITRQRDLVAQVVLLVRRPSLGRRHPPRAQGARRARRHRDRLPDARGAGGERAGAGPRFRRRVQALRADAGAGPPRASHLRAVRPGGRVPERAARADAARSSPTSTRSSTSATGSRSTACAASAASASWAPCERARRARAVRRVRRWAAELPLALRAAAGALLHRFSHRHDRCRR